MTRSLRFLIVEDSADDAEMALLELSRGGVTPDWRRVDSAAELQAALADGPWDAVLSDYTMPGFGAVEAFALCRAADPDLPFLVVSGTIGEERAVAMMQAGASDYVLKDNLARLAAAVEREVREADGRRARRRAERAAALLASVVESSDDAILSKSLDGVVTSWNPGAERLYGWTAAEAVGRDAFFLVPPDHAEEMAGILARLGRGERVESFETVRLHRDGTRVEVAVTACPLRDRDGRPTGYSWIARDIGRRKRGDARQARDALILANVRDAVVVTDADGVVTDWNDGATRLFGWTAAEMVGRPYADRYPEPERTAIAEGVRRRVVGEGWSGEYETVRKDGTRAWIDARVSRITDAAGRVVGVLGLSHDITDRKRAEAAARSSETQLKLFVHHVSTPIAMLDRDMRYLHVSRRWLTDYDLGDRDLTGLSHYDVFPDAPLHWKEIHQRCLAGAVDRCEEARFERANGTVQWIRWEVRPWTLTSGEIGGIVMFTEDITQRKSAEEAVRVSETRYRTLIDATTAIVWDSPPSGAFDSDQPAWTEFTGQSVEEHRGWGWLDAVHPDDRAESGRAWAAAMTSRAVYEVEHRLRRADGEYRDMSARAVPIIGPDGAVREWVGTHTDVTDRKRAEEALRLRDRAIQAATQGLLITDPNRPDNPVIYVSPGSERMTGYGLADFLGRNCRILQGVDTDPAAVASLRQLIRDDEPGTVELLNYRKDGSTFWNEVSVAPVRDDAGRLTHFVGVQTDVTARRALEEQFRQVQKMEAFGQLAGGVAHDFNNLLTIINGYSDMLLEELPAGDPSREMIAEIYKAGERSAGLTRQLLAFSRQQVLAPRVLSLNEVVTDTGSMLRRLLGEDIDLVTVLDPVLDAVRADPGQVEQVLMNLAVNARDAMPTGGRLTVETRNVDLDAAYARTHPDAHAGRHVVLSVSDTGTGMPPEVAAKVFEPFFTTKGPGKGTGLGLATVFGIVKQSGGHVSVYTEVGVGTAFKVYLPRAEGSSAVEASCPWPRTLPRGTETVLLAEDEATVRALASRILSGCGYTVIEVADGVEAVRAAAGHGGPIHLLVTDVVMPGLGGRAVAERVAETCPGVRVLFLSGYTDDAVIRHGVLTEGMNFLQKPFSPATLAAKVREVLDAPAALLGDASR